MSFPDVPIGALFDVKNGATPASGEGGYWDGDIPWVTPADLGGLSGRRIAGGTRLITQDGFENCGTQMVPMDSLILSVRAPIGHLAIATVPMCFNQGCRGLIPRRAITAEYAYWALLAKKSELEAAGQGTTFVELGRARLRGVKLPLPDLDTQKAIAAFLDRETARIDQLIAKKERQAALLLVKGGQLLDSLTFLSAWSFSSTAVPFKWICRIPNGQVDPTEDEWAQLPLIAPNHIEQGTGRLLYTETAREQSADSGKYAFSAGTVIYSKIRPNLAKACIAPEAGLCSADMYPIVPSKRLLPHFLLMQLLSRTFTDWATTESMRVAMPKINRETLGAFRLLVPKIEIQETAIKKWLQLRQNTERSRSAITKSVSLLREKRTALITAAVAGQIDVRQNAPAIVTKPDRARFRLIVGAEIVQRHQNTKRFGRIKNQKLLFLAEAHAGIGELGGDYVRFAAGPYDAGLIEETERAMEAASYFRAQPPGGDSRGVTYVALQRAGQHAAELNALLGDRADGLRKLIDLLHDFDTEAVEAVATLYAVWNDALMDGRQPDDDAIVRGVLTEWHRDKAKFTGATLRHWLDWMKRQGLTPCGRGPRTAHTMTRDMFP